MGFLPKFLVVEVIFCIHAIFVFMQYEVAVLWGFAWGDNTARALCCLVNYLTFEDQCT
jgi:hypothetical protein